MIPEWIVHILEGLGLPGAIIFVLCGTQAASIAYIRQMQARADKIYGYRLQERDTLNKTLSDTGKVLTDMLKVTDERNELTEEQARLLEKQAQAFELLKVSILAQYDNIKDHNAASAKAVESMADAIRALNAAVMENRTLSLQYVSDVRKSIDDMSNKMADAIRGAGQAQVVEMRNLLGQVTTVSRRRKI
jgi:hypothetical protein